VIIPLRTTQPEPMGSSTLPKIQAAEKSSHDSSDTILEAKDWKARNDSTDNRIFRLHTIALSLLPDKKPTSSMESVAISCLLEPDHIPRLPYPLPMAVPPVTNPPYRILRTLNKGAGMFATRDIPAGDLIVEEHPVLILPSDEFPDDVYERLGEALPEERRGELMSMANCRSKEECGTYVEGVVRTNAVMLELLPAKEKGKGGEEGTVGERTLYGGVYPLINRCNHR